MTIGLHIASLELGPGTIGLCPMPGRIGAYGEDLRALRAWGPEIVVSMTERQEFAGPLPADLASAGISWEHLPIRDMGAPPDEICAIWPNVSARLHSILASGGRVLVHCYGGCGRSGMVVLRLMIEAGEAPDMALRRLRAVRTCAVETEAQLDWATTGR